MTFVLETPFPFLSQPLRRRGSQNNVVKLKTLFQTMHDGWSFGKFLSRYASEEVWSSKLIILGQLQSL